MKKRIAVLGIGAVALFAAAGCAEEKAESADPTTTTTTEVEVDRNQQIANTYAKAAPGGLAQVCRAMPLIGRPQTERLAVKMLGAQIISFGGDVEPVVDYLLDRC